MKGNCAVTNEMTGAQTPKIAKKDGPNICGPSEPRDMSLKNARKDTHTQTKKFE
ncbi:MAG: hypothetical protein WAV98_01630 [Minisyncoccia bacterium]